MKSFFVCFLVCFSCFVHGQEVPGKIYIKKSHWKVSMTSDDSIFWIEKQNLIAIQVEGGTNYAIKIDGGTLVKTKGKYLVLVKQEGAAVLSVYELLANNKKKVIYSKLYLVKHIPLPEIKVCGVAPDSVIDKRQLIELNTITVYDSFHKQYLKLLGFSIVFSRGGNVTKLPSENCHFTIEMRNKIHLLESGSLLYFENIYCLMPDNKVKKLNDFQLFVSDSGVVRIAGSE